MLKYDIAKDDLTHAFMRFWVDNYVQIEDEARRDAFVGLLQAYGFVVSTHQLDNTYVMVKTDQ